MLFRALGVLSDQEILERIVYNIKDEQMGPMLDMLFGSLQEGSEYDDEDIALKWIGSKYISKKDDEDDPEKLTEHGKKLINMFTLPHIGLDEQAKDRKAYFLGYMTHRLLNASLGKTDQDDRDHYGKKRLDMAGSLMMQVFKQAFTKMYMKDVKTSLEYSINGTKKYVQGAHERLK